MGEVLAAVGVAAVWGGVFGALRVSVDLPVWRLITGALMVIVGSDVGRAGLGLIEVSETGRAVSISATIATIAMAVASAGLSLLAGMKKQ